MSENEKTVAKVVIIDQDHQYLLMYRSEHPIFGIDPDLPGGTQEDDETEFETMLREAEEEAGVIIDPSAAYEVFSSTDYSDHESKYILFGARVDQRPDIEMSWEHSSYEWVPRHEFIEKCMAANDSYMHMVGDAVSAEPALLNPAK